MPLPLRSCCAIAFLLALSNQLVASETSGVRFQHISRDEGLSQSFVYAILQDQEGYMWFGTQEGLNRYDGFNFTIFSHEPGDPRSLSDESVRTMIRDRSGALWVGTDAGGLSRYDSVTGSFTNYLHDPADTTSISDNRIRVVYEDNAGDLWVGTDGGGLDRFDRETRTFTHYVNDPSDANSLSDDRVWSILEDGAGALWIATYDGLNRLDPRSGSFARFRHDPSVSSSLSDNRIRVLFEDKDNTLWIGTEDGGLNRLDPENETFEWFQHDPGDRFSISANRINTIYQDNAGVLWIGTVNGLNAWDPARRRFERYIANPADRYSLPHNNVASIFQDRSGVLWVGTLNGLGYWNQATRAMLHYRNSSDDSTSLSNDTVTSFSEDRAGHLWIATYGGGLNVLNRKTDQMRHIRHDPDDPLSLSSDRPMSLHTDSDGIVWVGTRASGLNRYDSDSDSFRHFRHDPGDPASISSDGVTYILEGSNGLLWVGTFGGGLNALDRASGQFRRFQHNPDDPLTLSNDRILTLFEDSDGFLWVGTFGGGLNRLDPGTGSFTRYPAEPDRAEGLASDEVDVIEEDADGNLWIGLKGAGLMRWRRADRQAGIADFQRFDTTDGLPHATVYSAVWDQAGHLWLSTGRGLSVLDTATLTFRNYDTSHGLQDDEFNLSAGFRAADGQIFFGGVSGFNAFYPNMINVERTPPLVVITKFLSLNKPVDMANGKLTGAPARLRHDQNVIGFEFAGLDYAAPKKNRYAYQLIGLDHGWVDAGFNRQVTYSNLPAGNYTFRVKVANYDGIWSEQDATLDFTMIPAPWRTWWAYLLYASALIVVLLLIMRGQVQRTRQAAALRHAVDFAAIQERLNEAQRIASIGNWDWNIESDDLWWSEEIHRLFQIEPDTFSASIQAALERVHPDDRDEVYASIKRALNNLAPYAMDHRIALPDGTERIVHSRAEVSFNDHGKAIRMAGTVHDITERKRSEDEIRHSAEFQALLAELSSRLMVARTSNIDEPVQDGLRMVGNKFELDAVSVWWFGKDEKIIRSRHRWVREENGNRQTKVRRSEVPWIAGQLKAGKTIAVHDIENLPDEAAKEKNMFRWRGTKSVLIVPLSDEEKLRGACIFSEFREKRLWTAETIAELKLVADTLAGAVVRSEAVAEIERLKEKLQVENLYLRDEIRLANGFADIVGEDRGLKKCLMAVEKVAPTDVPVLILGETGTGKELIARAIHNLSDRRDEPMISVNCPTLPANLIESELFGHEKGAFTGAHSMRRGRFEIANNGTIFLDEIGELPVELQSKLLRVLQTGEFVRLGGTETLRTDVRVIAATNRNLERGIEKGEFRADLYYRINSFPIRLPALRDRKGDIPLLAEHFVRKHAGRLGKKIDAISASMVQELNDYGWPGNIRELESVIERALITSSTQTVLELPDVLPSIMRYPEKDDSTTANERLDIAAAERSHIVAALERTRWKISGDDGAATMLGMPESTLRSKIKRLGITRE